jgi:hypothetical protein
MTRVSSPTMVPPELASQVLSPDARVRAIERAFVARLVSRLSTGARSSTRRVEAIVQSLDAGELDDAIGRLAPAADELAAERFEDVREFNHDSWKSRHG